MDLLLAVGHPALLIFGGITIVIATLSVNVAANIMPACYDLVNLFPRTLNFRTAGLAVLGIGLLFAPWIWFKNADSIFKVLSAIGGVLGPVTGIMLADYFGLRHQHYDVADLYRYDGRYGGFGGWNPAGLVAFVVGGLAALSGLIVPALASLYAFSWFIGVALGGIVYLVLARALSPLPPA